MLMSGSRSYYDDYARKRGSSRLIHDPPALLTDRGAYVNFLEVQLDRVSSACLSVQSYDQRFNDIQNNLINIEEKLQTTSKLIALSQQCAEEIRNESDIKLTAAVNKSSQDNNDVILLISNMSNRLDNIENIVNSSLNNMVNKLDKLESKYNDSIHAIEIETNKMNQLYSNITSNETIIKSKLEDSINNNNNKIIQLEKLINDNIDKQSDNINKQIDQIYKYINESNNLIIEKSINICNNNSNILKNDLKEKIDQSNNINKNLIDELKNNLIFIIDESNNEISNYMNYISDTINDLINESNINKNLYKNLENNINLLNQQYEYMNKYMDSINLKIDNSTVTFDKKIQESYNKNDIIELENINNSNDNNKNIYEANQTSLNNFDDNINKKQSIPLDVIESSKSTSKQFTFDMKSSTPKVSIAAESLLEQQLLANNEFKDIFTQFLKDYQKDQIDMKNKLESLNIKTSSCSPKVFNPSIKTPKDDSRSSTPINRSTRLSGFPVDIPKASTPKNESIKLSVSPKDAQKRVSPKREETIGDKSKSMEESLNTSSNSYPRGTTPKSSVRYFDFNKSPKSQILLTPSSDSSQRYESRTSPLSSRNNEIAVSQEKSANSIVPIPILKSPKINLKDLSQNFQSHKPKVSINVTENTEEVNSEIVDTKIEEIERNTEDSGKDANYDIHETNDYIDESNNESTSANNNSILGSSPTKIPRYIKNSKPWIPPRNVHIISNQLRMRYSISPTERKPLSKENSITSAREYFGNKVNSLTVEETRPTTGHSDQSIESSSTSLSSKSLSIYSKEPFKTQLQKRQLTDHMRGSGARLK